MSTRRSAALLAAACMSAALAGCGGPGADPEPIRTTHVVVPGPWVFEPAVIQVAPGAAVTFENRGGATHSVTIDALGVDFDLAPGASREVEFHAEGDFAYVCKYHPPDMRGRVLVAAGERSEPTRSTPPTGDSRDGEEDDTTDSNGTKRALLDLEG